MDSSDEKAEAKKLGWNIITTSYPFETPWMRLRQDHLSTPSGETTYTYHSSKGSACIVPITATGEIVLIQQYRYPVDCWCYEVPAGGFSNKADISLETLAREELQEEIGAICEKLEFIADYFPSNSFSQEVCSVYLAVGTQMVQAQVLEDNEMIKLYPLRARDAFALAYSGGIKDAYSALSLFLCEPRIRELGYLS